MITQRQIVCAAFLAAAAIPVFAQQSSPLSRYVGTYQKQGEPETAIAVYLRNGELTFDSVRDLPNPLTAAGDGIFNALPGPLQLRFDGSGVVLQAIADGRTTTISTLTRTSSETTPLNHGQPYTSTEALVSMRDGVKLHVVIVRPVGSETSGPPLPILLQRTPYGVNDMNSRYVNRTKPELAASGYIFIGADIRGRYGSGGQFVMNRPLVHRLGDRTDPKLIDESTDCYDTVEWLVKNLPNNSGRVGVLGVSYPGFLTMMAGIDHHPAVKAISPQAPMTDAWLGDDFFHNGALRETYVFDYSQELERGSDDQTVDMPGDTFDFFLKNVNFAGASAAAGSTALPTTRHVLNEPTYAASWRAVAVQYHLSAPEVPTLEVGGYFDQEDMWGTQAEYAALRRHEAAADPLHRVFLVLGPWNHGGWAGAGRTLAGLNFGAATGWEYRQTIEAPFFEHYLKDRGSFDLQDTASFRTGANQWQRYSEWPPHSGFAPAQIYLHGDGSLSFTTPQQNSAAVSYVSDPANPIPYRQRPIQSTYGKESLWRPWLATDQSFLRTRTDIARFASPVLDRDTTVTGDIIADIFASTTGTDGDFVVKLIDESPAAAPGAMAGYQAMVVDEIFRGRYRTSFEKPAPIPAGKVQEYRWSLHAADHTFLKGHRMLVTVQSTWFPLYDRNPQTFVPSIPSAPAASYRPATISIQTSAQYPSHLEVLRPTAELAAAVASR